MDGNSRVRQRDRTGVGEGRRDVKELWLPKRYATIGFACANTTNK
jgi:hypothetical protein